MKVCIKVEYSSAVSFQVGFVHFNLMKTDKFTQNLRNLQPNWSLFSLLTLIAVEPTIALSRHTCCLYTLNPRIQVFCSERVAHLQQRGESMNVYPPLSILIATSLASGFGQLTSGKFCRTPSFGAFMRVQFSSWSKIGTIRGNRGTLVRGNSPKNDRMAPSWRHKEKWRNSYQFTLLSSARVGDF